MTHLFQDKTPAPLLNYMKYMRNAQLTEGMKKLLPFAEFVISG